MDSLMDRHKNGVSELVNRGNWGSREITLYSVLYIYIKQKESPGIYVHTKRPEYNYSFKK